MEVLRWRAEEVKRRRGEDVVQRYRYRYRGTDVLRC